MRKKGAVACGVGWGDCARWVCLCGDYCGKHGVGGKGWGYTSLWRPKGDMEIGYMPESGGRVGRQACRRMYYGVAAQTDLCKLVEMRGVGMV